MKLSLEGTVYVANYHYCPNIATITVVFISQEKTVETILGATGKCRVVRVSRLLPLTCTLQFKAGSLVNFATISAK
jgi:hypothetical protein